MSEVKKAMIVGGLVAALAVVGVPVLMYVSYNNQEVAIRARAEAQQEANKAVFDAVWKTIKQNAEVTEAYKDSFKEVYASIMSDRYDGQARAGALMSWIHEANPQFDSAAFTKLMTTIEAQRATFLDNQKMLLDIKRQHDTLLARIPARFFVGGRDEIVVTIVTSDKAAEVFEAKTENDISLFE